MANRTPKVNGWLARLVRPLARPYLVRRGAALSFVSTTLLMGRVVFGCVIPLSSSMSVGAGTSGNGTIDQPGESDAAIPTGRWTNVTSNLAGITSACGPLSFLSVKPDEDMLIAGIAQIGLYASRDGGGSWQKLGMGVGSAQITNDLSNIVYDPENTNRYWEAGIYGPGVFETMDDGNTFIQLGNISHCDLVSVDLSDPERQTLLAGGHEQARTLYRSTDGGMTWTNVGSGLPASTNCTRPLIVDQNTYLVGCAGYGGGPSGIYRTTDAAQTWTQVSSSGGGSAPLQASDGSIYWMGPNGSVARSTDNGQTWTDVFGPNVLTSYRPIQLPGNTVAALANQYVMESSNEGMAWVPATSQLPSDNMEYVTGVAYSVPRHAFYIWQNICSGSPVLVPADAVMRYP